MTKINENILNNYRKIWKEHNGEIPIDDEGRTFEIHHLNGDRNDNRIENLVCVSIDEHYEIHLKQGDYGACMLIADRMRGIDSKEKSDLATKNNNKRVLDGTHQFLGGEIGKKANQKQIDDGVHKFFDREFQRKQVKRRQRLIDEGKFHLQGGDIQRATHDKRKREGISWHTEGNVPSINKQGVIKMIPKRTYYSQKGKNIDWEWMATSSNEGKKRKEERVFA